MATGTPFLALFTFFSITSIYIGVRWFTTDTFKVRNFSWVSKIVSIVYILLVLISQYFINLKHTKTVCGGTEQRTKALLFTIVPNILMFGLVFGLLIILPGWKAPFANTIGYTVIKTMGVTDLLRGMMKTAKELKSGNTEGKPIEGKQAPKLSSGQQGGGHRGGQGKADQPPAPLPPDPPSPSVVAAKKVAKEKAKEMRIEMKEIIKYVQDDPSLIINEITPENWDQWMEKTALPKLFKKQYTVNKNHPDIARLYNLVSIRDLMGEFIWLILAGFLVITTQTNAIYSINCKGETSKMEQKIAEQWQKIENRAKNTEKQKFWTRE